MQITRTTGFYLIREVIPFYDCWPGCRVELERCHVSGEPGQYVPPDDDDAPASLTVEVVVPRTGDGSSDVADLFALHAAGATLQAEVTTCPAHVDRALRHFALLTDWEREEGAPPSFIARVQHAAAPR